MSLDNELAQLYIYSYNEQQHAGSSAVLIITDLLLLVATI
jgi:hypothetical protein